LTEKLAEDLIEMGTSSKTPLEEDHAYLNSHWSYFSNVICKRIYNFTKRLTNKYDCLID